jgi:hypothetical protein
MAFYFGFEKLGRLRGAWMGLQDFDFLTLTDVAAILHVSKAHVCKAVAGRVPGCPPIPSVALGRRKLVRRESLLAWIEANEKAGTMTASPETRPAKTLSEKGERNA